MPNVSVDPIDPLLAAQAWLARDGKVALATIIDTWGSSPVPVGGQMAVAVDGRFQGSVSGGCVEGEVITEAMELFEGGSMKVLAFGVADETAWQVGLPCGGQIKIMVERLDGSEGRALLDQVVAARKARQGLVVRTRLADGRREILDRASARLEPRFERRFHSGKSTLEAEPEGDVFVHALMPPPRVLIIGATHIGQVLAELTRLCGYEAVVVDPRTAFAAEARFPGVRLVTEWPEDALVKLGLDPYTAVAALAHVGQIDDQALKLAVASECAYIGALGSKRNHAKRTERLLAAGIRPEQIQRIRCPIGLDIGASTPPEIAVAVMAEIIRALRGEKGKGEQAL
jgi:xanthine dehydrogenase accessory factor